MMNLLKLFLKHHNNTYIMEEAALSSSTKDGWVSALHIFL